MQQKQKLDLSLYQEYYKRLDVLFELIKTMRGREVMLVGADGLPVRGIKAHNVSYLQNNFDAFHFLEKPYNMYNSVASLMYMPQFSYAPKVRARQYEFFTKNFKKYFTDYDLCFDFDGHDNFGLCYQETATLKELFDEHNIPYYLKFSGSGFHLVISGNFIEGKSAMDKLKHINYYGNYLNNFCMFSTLDASIYDSRRVFKTPYSIDVKTGRVALPLNDNQFKDFDFDLVKIKNVLKDVEIKNRGLLQRSGTKEDFTKFVDNVIYG